MVIILASDITVRQGHASLVSGNAADGLTSLVRVLSFIRLPSTLAVQHRLIRLVALTTAQPRWCLTAGVLSLPWSELEDIRWDHSCPMQPLYRAPTNSLWSTEVYDAHSLVYFQRCSIS